MVFGDHTHSIFNDTECAETQEVHLEQSGGFSDTVVKLRHQHTIVLVGCDGDIAGDFVGGDDYPAGMDASIAHGAFQLFGCADHLADWILACGHFAEPVSLFDILAVHFRFELGVEVAFGQYLGQ